MFTGLVQAVGSVRSIEPGTDRTRLEVDLGAWDHRPDEGDSIAVSGCCLTVARRDEGGRRVGFDCVPETMRTTALGRLAAGGRVNLEHAARPQTLLGGHLVQGHVDATGEVVRIDRAGGEWRMRIATPERFGPWLVERGSIAIDGVSLTLAAISPPGSPPWCEVCLIPVTLERTTLGSLAPGATVNLEADCLVKMVARQLAFLRGDGGR